MFVKNESVSSDVTNKLEFCCMMSFSVWSSGGKLLLQSSEEIWPTTIVCANSLRYRPDFSNTFLTNGLRLFAK